LQVTPSAARRLRVAARAEGESAVALSKYVCCLGVIATTLSIASGVPTNARCVAELQRRMTMEATMNFTTKLAASAVAFALAGAALADVTLYGREDYRGRSMTLDRAFPDLAQSSLDDRASSLTVRNGSWQLCSESFFRGQCVVLRPGDYPSLRAIGLNNAVSSVREVQPPGERRVITTAGRGVVLYERPNFSGHSLAIESTANNLDPYNDWARSMIVYDGTWELCEHDRFRGDCGRFGPGRYENLGRLAGGVSSLRPIEVFASSPSPVAPRVIAPRVVLYEDANFRGRSMAIEEDLLANLQVTGFNNRASSVRVDAGSWVMCSDANFQGQCWTFGPGEYPVLPAGLADRVSSTRRVADSGEPGFR